MKVLFVALLVTFSAISAHGALSQEELLLDTQSAFIREVGGSTVDEAYYQKLVPQVENFVHENRVRFDSSQFFLLVDRNHEVQKAFLAFFDAAGGKVMLLGADKVSTGNPNRRGYFETPTGIFENSPTNMNYRALGTKNEHGWRGLGIKGSRVWDLGWQRTVKGKGEPMDIRLMVHATDPDQGEQRLGTIQSQGCIRVSSRFNKFLDQHGVLDQAYETNAKAKYVLLATRNPIPFAGKYVVVIDSR